MKRLLGSMMGLSLVGFGLASFGTLACSSGDDSQGTEVDDATSITALEVNEDGTAEEAADAVDEQPLLLRGCGLGRLKSHVVGLFDVDGDGTLNRGERGLVSGEFGHKSGLGQGRHRGVARAVRLGLLLEVYDADASGALDEAERAALASDLEARCANRTADLLAEFDADGDGTLSETEWQSAHQAIRERFAARRAEILAEFDLDGDGELNDDEKLAARTAIRERLEAARAALIANFDENADGVLDETEHAALADYLRSVIRGEVSLADALAQL